MAKRHPSLPLACRRLQTAVEDELPEGGKGERLGEGVGVLIARRDLDVVDLAVANGVAGVMVSDIDVLRSC